MRWRWSLSCGRAMTPWRRSRPGSWRGRLLGVGNSNGSSKRAGRASREGADRLAAGSSEERLDRRSLAEPEGVFDQLGGGAVHGALAAGQEFGEMRINVLVFARRVARRQAVVDEEFGAA